MNRSLFLNPVYTPLIAIPLVLEAMLVKEPLIFYMGVDGLEPFPVNSNSDDNIPPHSVIGSIYPLSVHENLGE